MIPWNRFLGSLKVEKFGLWFSSLAFRLCISSFITVLSMPFSQLEIYFKNLICLSGDGQREPDLAPLQGQRLQAGGPRSGTALVQLTD